MRISLTRLLPACALLIYGGMGFTTVNPITVSYLNNGTTDFSLYINGSAYYVVAVNAAVMQTANPMVRI